MSSRPHSHVFRLCEEARYPKGTYACSRRVAHIVIFYLYIFKHLDVKIGASFEFIIFSNVSFLGSLDAIYLAKYHLVDSLET